MALPPIKYDGTTITAGPFTLEPASKNWKRRRTYWRCRLDGVAVTGWTFSPRLAVAAAVRKTAP